MCHAVIFTWSWNVRMPVISHLHQANFGPALLILTNSHLSFLNQAFYEYKYQTTSIYSSNNLYILPTMFARFAIIAAVIAASVSTSSNIHDSCTEFLEL